MSDSDDKREVSSARKAVGLADDAFVFVAKAIVAAGNHLETGISRGYVKLKTSLKPQRQKPKTSQVLFSSEDGKLIWGLLVPPPSGNGLDAQKLLQLLLRQIQDALNVTESSELQPGESDVELSPKPSMPDREIRDEVLIQSLLERLQNAVEAVSTGPQPSESDVEPRETSSMPDLKTRDEVLIHSLLERLQNAVEARGQAQVTKESEPPYDAESRKKTDESPAVEPMLKTAGEGSCPSRRCHTLRPSQLVEWRSTRISTSSSFPPGLRRKIFEQGKIESPKKVTAGQDTQSLTHEQGNVALRDSDSDSILMRNTPPDTRDILDSVKVPPDPTDPFDVTAFLAGHTASDRAHLLRLYLVMERVVRGEETAHDQVSRSMKALGSKAEPVLLAAANNASLDLVNFALEGLMQIGSPALYQQIDELMQFGDEANRVVALRVAQRLNGEESRQFFERAVRDQSIRVRLRAVSYLSWRNEQWAKKLLADLCNDPARSVRMTALESVALAKPRATQKKYNRLARSLSREQLNRFRALLNDASEESGENWEPKDSSEESWED